MRRLSAPLLCAGPLLLAPSADAQRPAERLPAERPPAVTPVASRSTPRPAPRADAAPVGGFAMKGITLTPGQQVLVREIDARYLAERATITAGDPRRATRPAVRAALFRSIDRMLAEEREVLTAAQRRRFDENVEAIHASWARLQAR
jgi:hypothetical protein